MTNNIKDEWIIYKVKAGAPIYGLETENSDIDIRGIYNVPLLDYLCPGWPTKVVVNNEVEDSVMMETITYLKLIVDGNPNLIDWLYAPEELIITRKFKVQKLRDDKAIFVTKRMLIKSLSMAQSMLSRCRKKKELQWKMLSHAKRLLYTVSAHVKGESYSPLLTSPQQIEELINIKFGKGDYWELVTQVEQGIEAWYPLIRANDDIPESVSNEYRDGLIYHFKLWK